MKKRLLVVGPIAIMSAVLVASGQTAERQPQSPGSALSASTQQAIIQQYCAACHNQKVKSGGLALDQLDIAQVAANAESWEKVVRKLRAGMMPPVNVRRPDPANTKALIAWLENELDRNAVFHAPAPGLHRLNRTEYANAIRDLLDLAIDPSTYLPSDDSSHGFDNMAGTLTLSSTLVEAYVSSAEKISRLAVGEATTPQLVIYRVPEDDSQNYSIEGLPFGTRGGTIVDHVFPSDGEYAITIIPLMGDNSVTAAFGSVPNEKLLVLVDGERVALLNWGIGRGGRVVPMQARFAAKAGPHKVGVTFLATNLAPALDLDRQFMRATIQTFRTPPELTLYPHVASIRVEGPYNAVAPEDSSTRRRIFVCRPAMPADEAACAQQIITNLATRAFRNPATAGAIDALMGFYRSGRSEGDFDTGIRLALSHVLAAPQFIYRIEPESPALRSGDAYRIGDPELASRLSYFLWSSAPDEELLQLAAQGKLTADNKIFEQQVRRMLADPRSEALAINFAGQWLNLRGMQKVTPFPKLYPDFDDPLRRAMRREVELLFDSIVREDRSVVDLLTADYTFVNERLALHYGIPNITGSQFRRVTLGPEFDMRRGLLGKGAILATTSMPERTSPVKRGQWVMANLIGMPPPDPPPNVPALPPRSGDSAGNTKEPTMREKMVQHRIRPDCVQCHRLMDPIGFALENFDAIAMWRTEDAGSPIDASEELYDGTHVNGLADLRKWLVGYSGQFTQVVTEKLLTYALGRGLDYQDMPLVRSIAREGAGHDNRFSVLVMGIVNSRAFRMNVKAASN